MLANVPLVFAPNKYVICSKDFCQKEYSIIFLSWVTQEQYHGNNSALASVRNKTSH